MYVLAVGLAPERLSKLSAACAAVGLPLSAIAARAPLDLHDDLLAAYFEIGSDGVPDAGPGVAPPGAGPDDAPKAVAALGALPVAVLADEAESSRGPAFLREVGRGYAMVLPCTVTEERLVRSLTYLRDIVPPPGAQHLWLDDGLVLSTRRRSVRLVPAEAAVLRRLAEAPGRVVSRTDLETAADGDVQGTSVRLKARLEEVGSGAQLLKVPHRGFRFVGTLHPGAAPSA